MLNEKDLGYSIGGPVGKPGGKNKMFFFYSHEFAPRTFGGETVRFRMPTALERAGDFSQTTNNNGVLFNYIKDPLLAGTCSAANQAACFRADGVLGRIPADRLYGTGLNILKMYPMPNMNAPGASYNYENIRPTEKLIANQPAVRFDYQPLSSLRGTFKYSGWSQKNTTITGTHPRLQRHAAVQADRRHLRGDGELQPGFVDFHRGDLRARAERADRLRPRPGGHRAVAL